MIKKEKQIQLVLLKKLQKSKGHQEVRTPRQFYINITT